MRIYIIGNDGIRLCREAPATVNQGEIAVASKKELHGAPLSGKRLLGLWNALPGVEKRKKLGDRGALIDQLWSAIEALPDPEPQPDAKRPSKRVGRKGSAQGRSCPALATPHGEAGHLRRLFHLQEHGAGRDLSRHRAEIPDQRSPLPDPGAPAQPLHTLLFLHPR